MVPPIYCHIRVLSANTVGPFCLREISHLELAKRIEGGEFRRDIAYRQAEKEIGFFYTKAACSNGK